jgi:hypothetical protein
MNPEIDLRNLRLFEDYEGFDDHFLLPRLEAIPQRPVIVICDVHRLSSDTAPQRAVIEVWGQKYLWFNWYEERQTIVEHALYMLDRSREGKDIVLAARIPRRRDPDKLRERALEIFKKHIGGAEPEVVLLQAHVGYDS